MNQGLIPVLFECWVEYAPIETEVLTADDIVNMTLLVVSAISS
jgi:hypothetical protein